MHHKALNIHHKPTRKVGFVLKPHGFKGNLRIVVEADDFTPVDFLFLEINQKYVPFAIQSYNPDSNIIKLQGYEKVEQLQELVNMPILDLLEAEISQQADEGIVGYTLTDNVSGVSFEVLGISYLPNNTLIEFRCDYKDMLLPFHEDIIIDINHETKTVLANFPDGILDL